MIVALIIGCVIIIAINIVMAWQDVTDMQKDAQNDSTDNTTNNTSR